MNEKLMALREECLACEKCGLCKGRQNVVFGIGDENSDVMFVGEGPGAQEDLQGEPFVGRSGQLLDKYLEAIGLDRHTNCYIANIVKCRPPENRDPSPEEQDVCIQYLREQTKIINPKIIVCLGRIAAQKLISPSFLVTKQHGEIIQKGRLSFMATFHPAALLRDPRRKPDALEDFLKLEKFLRGVK